MGSITLFGGRNFQFLYYLGVIRGSKLNSALLLKHLTSHESELPILGEVRTKTFQQFWQFVGSPLLS